MYLEQPKEFVDPYHLHCVIKLTKVLYGLKQAPRAWYERFTKFFTQSGYLSYLDSGPWSFCRRPLLLRPWVVGMPIDKPNVSKVPVWVRYPSIPVECWNGEALSRLSSFIGQPLYVDRNTSEQIRMDFASMCIEISVEAQLFDYLPLNIAVGTVHRQKCVYEWVPPICKQCMVFGHCTDSCKWEDSVGPRVENVGKEEGKQQEQAEDHQSILGGAANEGATPQCSAFIDKKLSRPDTRFNPVNLDTSVRQLSPISEDIEGVPQSNNLDHILSSALANALADPGVQSKSSKKKAKKKQHRVKAQGRPPDSSYVV
ncbi:hypothetical protein LIER_13048 [Lithospermum erythrorhizon]|uniref:DUF4283 domain-containing protein n=1 Tax=Lithospermum erythrorhizon TaxID=34254 RepID=A0AAV3PX79_LITER